jgi:hypothetical protein
MGSLYNEASSSMRAATQNDLVTAEGQDGIAVGGGDGLLAIDRQLSHGVCPALHRPDPRAFGAAFIQMPERWSMPPSCLRVTLPFGPTQ